MSASPNKLHFACILEYDGANFRGSQIQPTGRTVQLELEQALEKLYHTPIRARFASRTDAGVHASGQVVAFRPPKDLPLDTISAALNAYLPEDLKIRSTHEVHDDFSPRSAAQSRIYSYDLYVVPHKLALLRNSATHIRPPLDTDAIQEAMQFTKGRHDFASFAGPATAPDAYTIREMRQVALAKDGERLTMYFAANAFLHQQVRRLANALVAVGKHRLPMNEYQDLLKFPKRRMWSNMLPAHGLNLRAVIYDANEFNNTPHNS